MLDNNKSGGKRIDACMYFTFPPTAFKDLNFPSDFEKKFPECSLIL